MSYATYADRVSYIGQVMISHQFAPSFDLQITPSYISNSPSLIPSAEAQYVSLLATARIKISKHAGFIIDYGHPFSSFRNTDNGFYDPLGFGFEIETGGHVFTMNGTNAKAVDEINCLNNNQSD